MKKKFNYNLILKQQTKCEPNEICKYFDKSFYSCPETRTECRKFENFSKFPLCVPKNLNRKSLKKKLYF